MSVKCCTPESVKMIEVVEVISKRGEGIEGDPVRLVTQYWSTDNELLAENDLEITKKD